MFMTLTELLDDQKKYNKLAKKTKKLVKRNESKLNNVIMTHSSINCLTVFLLLEPSTLLQLIFCLFISFILLSSTIVFHAKILKEKYPKSDKNKKLFKYSSKESESLLKKNKEFFKNIEPTKENGDVLLNDSFYFVFIKMLEKSSKEEIEINKEKIENYIEKINKKEKKEVMPILSKKLITRKNNTHKTNIEYLDKLIKVKT